MLNEVRVQVEPPRFRIPDLCALRAEAARTPVVEEAPLLCVEVLSPRDSVTGMRRRVQDYLDMGVLAVWILDPQTRIAYVCRGSKMTEQREGRLRLAGIAIEVEVAEIFSTLDT